MGNIPQNDFGVIAAHSKSLAIGAERDTSNRHPVGAQGGELASMSNIPQDHSTVVTT
jgi:hypothetical protein